MSPRAALRPSRQERAPYTEALAQAVAEGRLTHSLYDERLAAAEQASSFDDLDALVEDLPFDPPPRPARAVTRSAASPSRRRFAPMVVAGLLAAGAMYAIVVAGGSEDTNAAEAPVAEDEGPPPGWEAPEIATEPDSVAPWEDTTVAAALERAQAAGFTRIEQVVLRPDSTSVTGMAEDPSGEEAFRTLMLGGDDAGVVTDEQGNSGVYLDTEGLDVDLDDFLDSAREAAGAPQDQEVRSVLVFQSEEGDDGPLVQVSFRQGETVTLRAFDGTVVD